MFEQAGDMLAIWDAIARTFHILIQLFQHASIALNRYRRQIKKHFKGMTYNFWSQTQPEYNYSDGITQCKQQWLTGNYFLIQNLHVFTNLTQLFSWHLTNLVENPQNAVTFVQATIHYLMMIQYIHIFIHIYIYIYIYLYIYIYIYIHIYMRTPIVTIPVSGTGLRSPLQM